MLKLAWPNHESLLAIGLLVLTGAILKRTFQRSASSRVGILYKRDMLLRRSLVEVSASAFSSGVHS